MLVTSLLWSSGSPPSRPRDAGAVDGIAAEAANDGALQVLLIQDPSHGRAAGFASARPIANPAPPIVAIASADALAKMAMSLPDIPVEQAETVSTPSPDAALRSALYGRYIGQIDARIERAWRRPRTTIGAPRFSCRVRIDQDSRGTVLEVTLEQCNGGERWQQSLVSAIESASPLPAPPDPRVFTRILRLSFRSQPYSPSAPQDAYEPLSAAAQPTGTGLGDDPNERALKALGRALRDPKPNRVISLTLIGHPADRSPAADLSTPVSAAPDPSLPPTRPPAE